MRLSIPALLVTAALPLCTLHADDLETEIKAAIAFNQADDQQQQDIVIPPPEEPEPEQPPVEKLAETPPPPRPARMKKEQPKPIVSFSPFTGKINKNKVRMRTQPNLESAIIRELVKGDMLIVTGENDEFYAVKPPMGTKAYIYRTYVLDGAVEGTRINVRLEPDTNSVVLAQLNNGDKVTGDICPLNSKWMEIQPPESVQFYVCKEHLEKIGDPDMMAKIDRRRSEVNVLLETTYTLSKLEMQKPFDEIALDDVNRNLETIVKTYSEFHEQVGRAKALQQSLKEDYLQKKIAYLEHKAQTLPIMMAEKKAATTTDAPATTIAAPSVKDNTPSPKMTTWLVAEENVFSSWSKEDEAKTLADFYEQQKNDCITLRGVIEPYDRPVRNKPGDYVLLNRASRLPVAFLYSTMINLENYSDQEISVQVTERPNNNFAFPAYFVIAVE